MKPKYTKHVEKARNFAIAAIEAYNKPGTHFRTSLYIVLIVIAWTALLHASFVKRRVRPVYSNGKGKGIRYERVDGEHRYWELKECLRQWYGDKNPAEKYNLEFLLGLRNKIEHRDLPELDGRLYGECQSALLNFEELITGEFGNNFALGQNLSISLQLSSVVPQEKHKAIKKALSREVSSIQDYVSRYRAGLPQTILSDQKFSFNIYMFPRTVNRESAAELAVQFIPSQDLERLGISESKLIAIKEKQVSVVNLDKMKPQQATNAVMKKIPFIFKLHHHAIAWKHFKVRPLKGSTTPEHTRDEFCVYDKLHKDYVYTNAWVVFLAKQLFNEKGFRTVIGEPPTPKSVT
ncbi:MAG: DUF3644 domain-containing protein [Candidatus Lambdaproteobacteria bacterium]|nr:DUF3644 domain-containing protein [Candidatus Lambdaproteobacteria bacterium]